MKFKYVGDCKAGEVTCFDTTFKQGEAVEVKNELFCEKLKNNPHFEVVKQRRKKVNDDNES